MAPGTRRANRSGYADHDDFEGLPVRQWRHDWVNVVPPPQQEPPQQNDIWSVDVIHGMPKDSHLLPAHSQELLLAARSGRLYKRPAPAEEEETDPDAIPDKLEKKDDEDSAKGYSIKLWKQVPRNVEAPAVSHLAKRRKNTVTIASKTIEDKPLGGTVTKATVRRVDATGNSYTEEVILAEGRKVVGEIIATRVETAPVLGAEPAVPVPQSNRRRPPPPKRKSKAGPGRGKKKGRIPLAAAAQPTVAVVPANGAAVAPTAVKPEPTAETAIKQEAEDSANPDSEMADPDDDDDDDDDGDDGDEADDGDEGAETPAESTQHGSANGEGDKAQDHEVANFVPAVETPSLDLPDVEMGGNEVSSESQASASPLSLAPPLPPLNLTPSMSRLEGSPLKNVIMPSPTTEFPPNISLDIASTAAPIVEQAIVPEAIPVETAAEPTVTELPSAVAEPVPETAVESVLPKVQSPNDDTLLPPPPEQVGNIATTPTAEDTGSTIADSTELVIEEVQLGEEAIPGGPSLEPEDTVMTEDDVKQEGSAPASFAMSEPSQAPTEPVAVEELKEAQESTEVPVEVPVEVPAEPSPEEAKPASPPVEDIPMTDDAPDEPDLLGGLLGELDREADKDMEMETETETPVVEPDFEAVAEAAPEPPSKLTPEPVLELAPEATPEAALEAAPETSAELVAELVVDPIVETVVETIVEPVAEPIVEPVAEPIVETVAEPIVETVVETIAEPVILSIADPVVEPVVEHTVEPTIEPVGEPVAELVAELAEAVPEVVPEPVDVIFEHVDETAADSTTELVTEPAAEPVSEPVLEAVPESAPASAEPSEALALEPETSEKREGEEAVLEALAPEVSLPEVPLPESSVSEALEAATDPPTEGPSAEREDATAS